MYTTLIVPTADGLLLATPEGRVQAHALKGVSLSDVIVHPEEPDVLYVASPDAGVWRSADGAQSWTQVLALPSRSLAMDADDIDSVMAGTSAGAVLATVDAGAHWEPVLDPSPGRGPILRLQNQPAAPEILYAHTASGKVLRSANRGRTWTSSAESLGAVRLITLHPRRVDSVFCAGPATVHQSSDGGRSWRDLFEVRAPIESMAVLPGDPDLLVIGAPAEGGVISGGSPDRLSEQVRLAPDACALAVDHDDPGCVYGVTRAGSLLLTVDAGQRWRKLDTLWPAPAGVVPLSHRPPG